VLEKFRDIKKIVCDANTKVKSDILKEEYKENLKFECKGHRSREHRPYSEKLIDTSLIETVRLRNMYSWKKIDRSSIEVVQKTLENVQRVTGFIELPDLDEVEESGLLIKSRDIADDYCQINGIYKKFYGRNATKKVDHCFYRNYNFLDCSRFPSSVFSEILSNLSFIWTGLLLERLAGSISLSVLGYCLR
jgi:hypothetical protein